MDKYERAVEELQKSFVNLQNYIYNNSPYNKELIGRIIEINGNVCKIVVNEVEYNNIPKLSNVSIELNDIVKINVPNNNINNMYIIGKLG